MKNHKISFKEDRRTIEFQKTSTVEGGDRKMDRIKKPKEEK